MSSNSFITTDASRARNIQNNGWSMPMPSNPQWALPQEHAPWAGEWGYGQSWGGERDGSLVEEIGRAGVGRGSAGDELVGGVLKAAAGNRISGGPAGPAGGKVDDQTAQEAGGQAGGPEPAQAVRPAPEPERPEGQVDGPEPGELAGIAATAGPPGGWVGPPREQVVLAVQPVVLAGPLQAEQPVELVVQHRLQGGPLPAAPHLAEAQSGQAAPQQSGFEPCSCREFLLVPKWVYQDSGPQRLSLGDNLKVTEWWNIASRQPIIPCSKRNYLDILFSPYVKPRIPH
eukprot:gene13204-biopygen3582